MKPVGKARKVPQRNQRAVSSRPRETQEGPEPGDGEHDQSHPHHDAEAEEWDQHRRPVLGRESLEPDLARGPVAGGNEAAELRDLDRKQITLARLVGNGDQHLARRLLQSASAPRSPRTSPVDA